MGFRAVLHRFKIDPVKIELTHSNEKSNVHKYISVAFGTLLTISESLPFFKNTEANGILDALAKGVEKLE